MNIFELLNHVSTEGDLPFFIIGGHAVNAYGYSRFTKDLDILVRREQRAEWTVALEQNAFSIKHDGGNFLRFTPPPACKWPLDLMLVNESTYANVRRDSREIEIDRWKFRVPSLDGLFAMKFHALKQQIRHRGYKDLLDILELARCNGIDMRSERVKSICDKFGSPKIYEEVLAFSS